MKDFLEKMRKNKWKDNQETDHPVLEHSEKEKNQNSSYFRYVMYLLLLTFVLTGVTLSRYSSTLSEADTARVAAFDYVIEVEDAQGESLIDVGSSSISNPVEFGLSLYATAKLSDAENCMFNDVARVVKVTITNNSEATVNAIINTLTEIEIEDGVDNRIVWCLFDEDETFSGTNAIYGAILEKLDYDSASDADVPAYSELIEDLNGANQDTIDIWNDNAVLNPNGVSKTLTFVFWAEHDDDYVVSNPLLLTLTQPIALDFTVSQVN